MSRVCDVTGKKPLKGHLVSHANNKTIRRWYPNLQVMRTKVEGETKRVRVCTGCIRSNKLVKA